MWFLMLKAECRSCTSTERTGLSQKAILMIRCLFANECSLPHLEELDGLYHYSRLVLLAKQWMLHRELLYGVH